MPRLPQKVEARCAEMKRAEREGGSALLSRATMRHVAESAADGQFAYVQEALGKEYELRHAPRIARLRQAAGFPCQKGFDGFEWEGISFPHGFTREDMLSPSFIGRHEDLVLHGGPGNGKSHTAIALGILACSQGRRVLFASTASLANDLRRANRDGTVQEMLGRLGRCDLMILDEWGYLPTDPDGARLLFRVVSMCCERISLALTTNIEFSRWGEIFNDDDMAKAMMDRIVHHGRLVTYNRESCRAKHALMREGDQEEGLAGHALFREEFS